VKFQILSHAGLLVEHNNTQIICDPWLIGSCYWRSWWNFPEPPSELVDNLDPDYIYLTHLHWDHFHGSTLKKFFDSQIHILVPKVPTRRMIEDLNWLGFYNITEIKHGSNFHLGKDFILHSYQFGLGVDSAVVLSGGGYTLLNCNDCKFFGHPLKQIIKQVPKIDFVLRSHSSATPIPYCIEDYETNFSNLRQTQDYIEEFSRFALFIGAKFAIPFASNHCFLHSETFHFNKTTVSAEDILPRYHQLAIDNKIKSECVVMAPGSSWSETEGFQIISFDYSNKNKYLEDLLELHSDKLAEQYNKEAQTLADFRAFSKYFEGFLGAIPWLVRKFLKLRFVFHTSDKKGQHYWIVDSTNVTIKVLEESSQDYVRIEMPALVLNDCCNLRMFSTWTASKRLKIHLPSPNQLKLIIFLFLLLDFYELEMLPLRRNFTFRSLGIRLRRWREIFEALNLFVQHRLLKRPFVLSNLYDLSKKIKTN
jgi:UDP-MurNAc hydroxylase